MPKFPLPRVAGNVSRAPALKSTALEKVKAATAAAAPVKAKAETPAAAEPAKKPRKKHVKKSAIDLALKRARLLDIHSRRLLELASNWEAEATPDQQATNTELITDLNRAARVAQAVLLNVDMLKANGFAPAATSRRGTALTAGAKVALKPKFYEPAAHGAVNQFEVVVVVDRFVRIQSTTPKQPQLVVLRSWLSLVDEIEVDETPPDLEEEEAEEADPDADPDLSADDDPDHRLPNEDVE